MLLQVSDGVVFATLCASNMFRFGVCGEVGLSRLYNGWCGEACVSCKGLSTCVCVNGGNVYAEESGKGSDRTVSRAWVCSDIVGDVVCKGWERGDKGFGEQHVCLVNRNGVVIVQFGDIQFEFDGMSIEILD